MRQSNGKIKAVVFDADGTLYEIRAEGAYEKMFSYLAKESGSDPRTVESVWRGHINNILNSNDARSAEKRKREYSIGIVLGQLGIIDDERVKWLTGNALKIFWEQILSDLKCRKGDTASILRLKEKLPLCVASDEYRKNLEMKLNFVFGDWKKAFKFLVSADDTGELKPSAKYAGMALSHLKLKPDEVIFVGDSWERDLAPAKHAGMRTLLVRKEKEGSPDFLAKNISEASKIINSLVG